MRDVISSNKKTNITPFWANVILWEFWSIVLLFLLLILHNLTQWLNPYIFELTKSWGSSWYNFHSGNSISWKIENFSSSFSADQIFIFTSKIGLKSSALCSETNPTEKMTIPLKKGVNSMEEPGPETRLELYWEKYGASGFFLVQNRQ